MTPLPTIASGGASAGPPLYLRITSRGSRAEPRATAKSDPQRSVSRRAWSQTSIRIPAALCGLTGLKPTYGLVSLAGVVPLATTLDSVGPLARTVEDATLVMGAIAGPDPADATTLSAMFVDFPAAIARSADIKGTRVTALAFEQLPADVEADVAAAYAATIQLLRDLGAHVDEESFAFDLEDVMLRNGRIIAAEAYAVHRAYIEDAALEIDPWVRQRTLAGKSVSAAEYLDELAHRRRAAARFAAWMIGRDALLTPTLPITAEIGRRRRRIIPPR